MSCIPGPHRYRVLRNRHHDQCLAVGDGCPGCEPCPDPHCRVCRKEHADTVCPECLGETREDLDAILILAPDLHAEATMGRGAVRVREGVPGGDALVLLSPGHYPDHHRLRAEEQSNDPRPPLVVLTHWADRWTAASGTTMATTTYHPTSLGNVGSYLDGQLHRIAAHPDLFVPMARDLSRVRRQVEDVLHAGDRPDTTRVPCLTCGVRLEKVWASRVAEDHWSCPRCGDTYDRGRYERAKYDHLASAGADRFVAVSEAVAAVGRPEQTVRAWIRKGLANTQRHPNSGRLLVWWPDVRTLHLNTKTRDRSTTP